MARKAVLLCLLPLFLLGSVHHVDSDDPTPPVLQVGFHLEEDSTTAFQTEFQLKISQLQGVSSADGHYVMPEEPFDGNEKRLLPVQWFSVELFGMLQQRATLYARGDTLYIMAFANQNGDIFYMSDAAAFPGAKYVGFTQDYKSLLGDSDKVSILFSQLNIGRTSALWAAGILANYDPQVTPELDVKRALAIFVLTVSESQRITGIRDSIRDTWFNGGYVTKDQAKCVQLWGSLSRAYCIHNPEQSWDTDVRKDLGQIKISTLAQVDQALGVVKRPVTETLWCPKPKSSRCFCPCEVHASYFLNCLLENCCNG